MRGLFLRRVFPEPIPSTCKITVIGALTASHKFSCLVMSDGTLVKNAGNFVVDCGAAIECSADGSVNEGVIILNGATVASGFPGTYTYTVKQDVTIELIADDLFNGDQIVITEG